MSIVIIVLSALTVILMVGCAYAGAYLLAMHQIFWAFVPEGQIIAVVTGENATLFLGNIRGHRVDPKTGEVTPIRDGNGQHDPTANDPENSKLNNRFGVYWIGLWPFSKVYKRTLHKMRYAKIDGETDFKIVPFDREVSGVMFQDTIPVVVTDAETIEKIPVTLTFLITTTVSNAERFLFKGVFPTNLIGSIDAVARDYAGRTKIDELTQQSHSGGATFEDTLKGRGNSELIGRIMLLNLDMRSHGGNNSLLNLYGFSIEAAVLLKYEIGKASEDPVTKATTAAFVAEKEAEAKRLVGLAEADVINAKAIAAVAGVTKMASDLDRLHPRTASAIALSQGMREHEGTLVIGAQTPFVTTEDAGRRGS